MNMIELHELIQVYLCNSRVIYKYVALNCKYYTVKNIEKL